MVFLLSSLSLSIFVSLLLTHTLTPAPTPFRPLVIVRRVLKTRRHTESNPESLCKANTPYNPTSSNPHPSEQTLPRSIQTTTNQGSKQSSRELKPVGELLAHPIAPATAVLAPIATATGTDDEYAYAPRSKNITTGEDKKERREKVGNKKRDRSRGGRKAQESSGGGAKDGGGSGSGGGGLFGRIVGHHRPPASSGSGSGYGSGSGSKSKCCGGDNDDDGGGDESGG